MSNSTIKKLISFAKRVSQNATTSSAKLLTYGAAATVLYMASGGVDPATVSQMSPLLAGLLGGIGADALSNMLDRVAHAGEDDEALEKILIDTFGPHQARLEEIGEQIGELLTQETFLASLSALQAELNEQGEVLQTALDEIKTLLENQSGTGVTNIKSDGGAVNTGNITASGDVVLRDQHNYYYETDGPKRADGCQDGADIQGRVNKDAKETPKRLAEQFGRQGAKDQLVALLDQVRQSQKSYAICMTGKPSIGKQALIDWFRWHCFDENNTKVESAFHSDDDIEHHDKTMQRWRSNIGKFTQNSNDRVYVLLVENIGWLGLGWLRRLENRGREWKKLGTQAPVLIVYMLDSHFPLADIPKAGQTDLNQLLQGLVEDGMLDECHLGQLIEDDVVDLVGHRSDLATRLHELSAGSPVIALSLWDEWKQVKAIEKDLDGRWVKADGFNQLPITGNIFDGLVEHLDELMTLLEDEPDYSMRQAQQILRTAALEGEVFTLEAVAMLCGHDPEVLEDFFDLHLTTYIDEDDSAENVAGIVEPVNDNGGCIFFTEDKKHFVTRYRFLKPYVSAGWHQDNMVDMDAYREATKTLAIILERLYTPFGRQLIADKLIALYTEAGEYALAAVIEESEQVKSELSILWKDIQPFLSADPNSLSKIDRRYLRARGAEFLGLLSRRTVGNNLGVSDRDYADMLEFGEGLVEWLSQTEKGQDKVVLVEYWLARYEQQMQTGNREEAKASLLQADDLFRTAYFRDRLRELRVVRLIGLEFYKRFNDLTVAKPYLEQTLAISRAMYGENHPDTATSLNNLGALFKDKGDLRVAKAYHEQALEIRRAVLGESHPDLAQSLNNYGLVFQTEGSLEIAKSYYEQALEIYRAMNMNSHPDVATLLINFGMLLKDVGDLTEARVCYEQVVEMYRVIYGANHLYTVIALNNLGLLLIDTGDLAAAKVHLEQALKICRTIYGEGHPYVATLLHSLGLRFQAEGDLAAAKSYLEQALAIYRAVYGDNHPDTAISLNNLESLLQEMG